MGAKAERRQERRAERKPVTPADSSTEPKSGLPETVTDLFDHTRVPWMAPNEARIVVLSPINSSGTTVYAGDISPAYKGAERVRELNPTEKGKIADTLTQAANNPLGLRTYDCLTSTDRECPAIRVVLVRGNAWDSNTLMLYYTLDKVTVDKQIADTVLQVGATHLGERSRFEHQLRTRYGYTGKKG